MQQFIRPVVLIGWLLISTNLLFAQTPAPDVLHRLDRTTQNVRVKEITDTEVFYTDLNTIAPVRKIGKAELWKVVFGDGTFDVYNEPKASQVATNTVAIKPTVTRPSTQPGRQPSAGQTTSQSSQPVTPSAVRSADLGMFLSGRKALSYGLNVAGSSATTKNSRTSTTATTNNIGLSVLYQHFKRDNVSIGGSLTIGLDHSKSTADAVTSTPFISLSGLTRRYLPVNNYIAFYGFGAAGLTLAWQSYKTGTATTTISQQRLSLDAGAGLAYLFNERWSVDFNTTLASLMLNRYQDELPTSKAYVDLSLTGTGVIPSFSLFLTRYF